MNLHIISCHFANRGICWKRHVYSTVVIVIFTIYGIDIVSLASRGETGWELAEEDAEEALRLSPGNAKAPAEKKIGKNGRLVGGAVDGGGTSWYVCCLFWLLHWYLVSLKTDVIWGDFFHFLSSSKLPNLDANDGRSNLGRSPEALYGSAMCLIKLEQLPEALKHCEVPKWAKSRSKKKLEKLISFLGEIMRNGRNALNE